MLILASQSPARKALLSGARVAFDVRPSHIDERRIETEAVARGADAMDVAALLARHKALMVAGLSPTSIVIGADQTLALGDELLHKPETMDAAATQLSYLKGKTHRLHAGVVLVQGDKVLWEHVQTAELTMRDFSDAERDEVLALEGEDVLSSVGGYRLEGPSVRLFEAITGDYFTILGLPLLPLLAALREHAPQYLKGAER